jgi:hypothetical protein
MKSGMDSPLLTVKHKRTRVMRTMTLAKNEKNDWQDIDIMALFSPKQENKSI